MTVFSISGYFYQKAQHQHYGGVFSPWAQTDVILLMVEIKKTPKVCKGILEEY